MINFGLWFIDTIGEEQIEIFRINLHKAYDEEVCMVLNKMILPIKFFFGFNSGLEFFKLYLERHFSSTIENQGGGGGSDSLKIANC